MLANALGIYPRQNTPAVATATASASASASTTASASASAKSSGGFSDIAAATAAFADAGLDAIPTDEALASSTAVYNTAPPAAAALASPATAAPSPLGGINHASYDTPAFLINSLPKDLNPSLSQDATNGGGTWGTVDNPALPNNLQGPVQNGSVWGSATASGTNYYDSNQIPNTGVTRFYDFTISQKTIAPDGVQIPGLVVNGQFPGPLIEANWGDWIQVTVTNTLTDDGAGIHWHGFLQKGTQYYDGVPSVQQCPIAPGSSFTYRFRADLYGSSWYHSHYSAQYAGGLLGPIVVHGPLNVNYDTDLGPVMLSDWYHQSWESLVAQTMSKANSGVPPPFSNNNLINGKMNYPCSNATKLPCKPNAGISKFKFTSGKKHRLRLINTSAEAVQKFSIDGHNMTVFANDFVQIQPYTTNVVTLGVGQRTDVIVQAIGKPTDSYWMRANISLPCSLNDGISPGAVAAIYYEKANTSTVPTSKSTLDPAKYAYCGNDDLSLTKPYLPLTPAPNPSVTQELNIVFTVNSTGYNVWEVNGQSFRGDYNDPTLLEAKLGNFNFPKERNVYNFFSNNTIRLVVYNYFQFGPHPMHLHGHNFFVLAEGHGIWDGHITNAGNPQRRDVQLVQPALSATQPAYIVLQINADNPGVWPFHCHIAWHVSGGLYVNILERPKDITQMNIPMVMAQTCRDWAKWSHTHVVDQIDSGL
ncbi:multicopper oxidase [Myriangium duriaei CBS 260.36]|uniref:Multicopper oxidase n=1 Tax=Myriangium duriaei CBS 260.36 TaxID=1168546 RepID=A0A9P4JA43_9PEZI|nr:multicopper oxidase [Myriangium duriaei CBS 260.36]